MPDVPSYAGKAGRLASWSENYDEGSPWLLFLDIIGWSGDQLGMPQFDMAKHAPLGYLEMGMLAEALDEYSDRPTDVMAVVEAIMGGSLDVHA